MNLKVNNMHAVIPAPFPDVQLFVSLVIQVGNLAIIFYFLPVSTHHSFLNYDPCTNKLSKSHMF